MTVGNQVVKDKFKAILRHTYITFTPIQFVHGRTIQRYKPRHQLYFPRLESKLLVLRLYVRQIRCCVELRYFMGMFWAQASSPFLWSVLTQGVNTSLQTKVWWFSLSCNHLRTIWARRSLLNTHPSPLWDTSQSVQCWSISVLEKWTLFFGLNKVRPKLEPWGVNDFFIHRNSAKFTATTNLLNFLCCTVRASGVKRNTYWIQLRKGDRETT